ARIPSRARRFAIRFSFGLCHPSFVLPVSVICVSSHSQLMKKTAVVTGAGSGVGQAIAIALAKQNWRVALVGRREETLRETVKRAGKNSNNLLVCPSDIGIVKAVEKLANRVLAEFKDVEVVVNAAGTNDPKSALEV